MSSAEGRAGFTLVETLGVMLIVALIATLAMPTGRGTGRGQLKALALETADLMRRERVGAVLTRRLRHVSVDGDARMLVGDETGDLPSIANHAAQFYEHKFTIGLDRVMGAIGPITIVVVSLIIGALIVSIMSALLSITELAL